MPPETRREIERESHQKRTNPNRVIVFLYNRPDLHFLSPFAAMLMLANASETLESYSSKN